MAATTHSTSNSEWRGPRRWCLASQETCRTRTYLRRADFEQWGLSEGCPGCRCLRRQQAHSEACRRRIEGLLEGESTGSARLAAADERINRALADVVERHAAKNSGMRCILKRDSAVCHPESEPQRKSHWTRSRAQHHAPQSRTEDHRRQVCDAAPPQGLHRTGPELAHAMK